MTKSGCNNGLVTAAFYLAVQMYKSECQMCESKLRFEYMKKNPRILSSLIFSKTSKTIVVTAGYMF